MTYKEVLDYFRKSKINHIAPRDRNYKGYIRIFIDHMWRD